MRVNDQAVGALFINFRQPQRFDAPQKQYIQSLANYAAIAIANARSYNALERAQMQEMAILRQIDQALSQKIDLQSTLQTILNLATAQIATTRAVIYLYNERLDGLRAEAAIPDLDPAHSRRFVLPLRERRGLVWSAFDQRQPVRVDDVHDPAWQELYIPLDAQTVAELDVPLLDGERTLGVINFESSTPAAFSERDQAFLVVLAGQAVLAVKNAQAYEREKRAAEENQALITVGAAISRTLDLPSVFRLILDQALTLTNSPAGTLMRYDPMRGDLQMADERGVRSERKNQGHRLDEGIVGLAATERKLINIGDVTTPEWRNVHLAYIADVRSELAVPLLEGGALLGVLNIESPELNHFAGRDERLMQGLANLAVVAIQNARRYSQAEARQNRLRELHHIDEQIINQTSDVERVIQVILQAALQLTGAEFGDLHRYEGDLPTQSFFLRPHADTHIFTRLTRDDPAFAEITRGIVAHVAQTGVSYRTREDAQTDELYQGDDDAHIHSEMAVPLLAGPHAIGVLNLESPQHFAFDDDDLDVLELLAGQAVIAIQNAQNYRRVQLLEQVGRDLATIADMAELNQAYLIVRNAARELQPHSQITTRRYKEDTEKLELVDHDPEHAIQPALTYGRDEGLNGRLMALRRTLLVSGPADEEYGTLLTQLSPLAHSWMGTPIRYNDAYYGNLAITFTQTNRVLEMDQLLFEELARQLAITIHRLETAQQMVETAKQMSEIKLMSSIGQSAGELTHRLGDDLGTIPTKVKQLHEQIARLADVDSRSMQKLTDIGADVQQVLTMNIDLKKQLAGMQELQQDSREVAALDVTHLLQQAGQSYPQKPDTVEIRIEVAVGVRSVNAVAREIADILRNLFVNAVQAMPHGGTIALRARNTGRFVAIQVADTGIGISTINQKRIFELFYSSKGSSGFGLWSARQYAQANGGDLSVESTEGQGTTFTLTLPRAMSKMIAGSV